MALGDPLGPAQLVLVPVEGAGEDDGVERHAVRRGEDLRVDDVAARRRAGAGDDGEQARMVGRQDGELRHAAERVGLEAGGDRAPGVLGLAHEAACLTRRVSTA